jgi:hypothetical protein
MAAESKSGPVFRSRYLHSLCIILPYHLHACHAKKISACQSCMMPLFTALLLPYWMYVWYSAQYGGKGGSAFDDMSSIPVDIKQWPIKVLHHHSSLTDDEDEGLLFHATFPSSWIICIVIGHQCTKWGTIG